MSYIDIQMLSSKLQWHKHSASNETQLIVICDTSF